MKRRLFLALVLASLSWPLPSWANPPVGRPPVCDYPPSPSGTIILPINVPYSTTIQVSDPDSGAYLKFTVTGLPPGATLTPPLPVNGGSPLSTVLSWTPTIADVGSYPITFTVTDFRGLTGTCPFTLQVVAPTPTPTPTPPANQ